MLEQYNDINIPCPVEDCDGHLTEPLIWNNEIITGTAPTRRVFGSCNCCGCDINLEQYQAHHRWFISRYYISGEMDGTGQMPSDTTWHDIQPVPKTAVLIPVEAFERVERQRELTKDQITNLLDTFKQTLTDIQRLIKNNL